MSAVWSFLYCTITGVVALLGYLVIIGLVVAPIIGGMYLWERAAESRPWMRFTAKQTGYLLLALIAIGLLSLFVLGMHDWGCDIHGHPEHKILDKKPADKPSPHEGHKP